MRKKKDKKREHEPIDDWKEVHESLVNLAETEDDEREEFQFMVLAAIVNWIITIIEEGMNLPPELKKMLGLDDNDNGLSGEVDYFS